MPSDYSTPARAPQPCIIDTDPGVDDVIAILLALASPELLIVAITLTHGNCSRSSALSNLQKTFSALELHLELNPEEKVHWPGVDLDLRRRLGRGPIDVYLGSEGPVKGEAVTAKYFHGRDGLSDVTTRHPALAPRSSTSPYFTLSSLSSTEALPGILTSFPPRTLSYVALGPLTSLAHLHALAPSPSTSLLHLFATILVMGGAVDAPGNTSPSAEFNTYADPHAAQVIFALHLPALYLFPLDITSHLTLPFDLYKSLVDPHFEGSHKPSEATHEGKTPLTHFTSAFLEVVIETMARYGGDSMELHDPAVIWALIDYARARQAALPSSSDSSTSPDLAALEPRRGSEMRRRVEASGFTRDVVERRRSVELARMARLERDAEAMPLGQVREMKVGEEEMETLEADEQSAEDDDEEEEEEEEAFAPSWEWKDVDFEVETTGTLTRGMLVVDRRRSATAHAGLSTRQTNRALAIEETEASPADGSQNQPQSLTAASGARVMVHSPGQETLRTMLLERIWGVKIGLP